MSVWSRCTAITKQGAVDDVYECDRPALVRVLYTPSIYTTPFPMCGQCIGALKRRRGRRRLTSFTEYPIDPPKEVERG